MGKITRKVKTRGKKKTVKEAELIVIDEKEGLIFETEEDLFKYFAGPIESLEKEYEKLRRTDDYTDDEQIDLEVYLEDTLEKPDQIWRDEKKLSEVVVHYFIKRVTHEGADLFYIAACYMNTEESFPTFIFIHFPTRFSDFVENFKTDEMVYDKTIEKVIGSAIEGDALSDGDPLAIGLFDSMLKIRAEKDISKNDFPNFSHFRESTIEEPDEIWRKMDPSGNVLVTFIKEFPEEEPKDLSYIVVTVEDTPNNVHALLFSFPTTDKTLVERYRQGENLDADEVIQESSH